jgi:hypothetical protein
MRWLAPELISSGGVRVTCSCSVKRVRYLCPRDADVRGTPVVMCPCPPAFGCIHVLFRRFLGYSRSKDDRNEGVILRVMSGARPNRPQGSLDLGLTDSVWGMIQACWGSSDRRWTISRIVSSLESSITPTAKEVKAVKSDERTEPQRQVFSTLVPPGASASAPKPDSEAARLNRRKKVFRKLKRLFRT